MNKNVYKMYALFIARLTVNIINFSTTKISNEKPYLAIDM